MLGGRQSIFGALIGLLALGFLAVARGSVLKVLFVGNSFTYVGNTDQVVQGLLSAAGWPASIQRYAEPNYNFARHAADAYNSGKALYSLLGPGGSQRYDYVVFQDESHEPGLGGDAYKSAQNNLDLLVKLAKDRGATPVLLLTWGYANGDRWEHPDIYSDYLAMQARLSAGYLSLAQAMREAEHTNAFIAPVGLAFQKIYTSTSVSATSMRLEGWEKWDPASRTWMAAHESVNRTSAAAPYPVGGFAPDIGALEGRSESTWGAANEEAPLLHTTKSVPSYGQAPALSEGPAIQPAEHTAMPAHESPTAAVSMAATPSEKNMSGQGLPSVSSASVLGPHPTAADIQAMLGNVQVGVPFQDIAAAIPWLTARLQLGPDATGPAANSQLPPMTQHSVAGVQSFAAVGVDSAVPAIAAPGLAVQTSDSWPKSKIVLDTEGDYRGKSEGTPVSEGGLEGSMGLPVGSGTFNWLYKDDGQHPSSLGTYLAACTIAASITGAHMTGNQYGPDLIGSNWATYLQQTADSIVFGGGTPSSFPKYPWQS